MTTLVNSIKIFGKELITILHNSCRKLRLILVLPGYITLMLREDRLIKQKTTLKTCKDSRQTLSSSYNICLLSLFSRVQLCVTAEMVAYQAPQSLGFSRQKHWRGCHFLFQCMKVKSESEVAQSCPNLSDPMDCSLPGSSVDGIFQARVLEWATTRVTIF